MFTNVYTCLIVFAYVNTTLPMFTPVYLSTYVYLFLTKFTRVLLCLALFTSAYLHMCTPVN